jgi:hypothetical protein
VYETTIAADDFLAAVRLAQQPVISVDLTDLRLRPSADTEVDLLAGRGTARLRLPISERTTKLKTHLLFAVAAFALLSTAGPASAQTSQFAVPPYNGQTSSDCVPSPSDKSVYPCPYPDGSFVWWLLGPTDWTVLTYRNGSCLPGQCEIHVTPDGVAYFNSHPESGMSAAPGDVLDATPMAHTPINVAPNAPDTTALPGPSFDDQSPDSCGVVPWDSPKDPNGRKVYVCTYSPIGVIATWRSASDARLLNYATDTDWLLLDYVTGCEFVISAPDFKPAAKTCTGESQITAEGHAYFDGPAPMAPPEAAPTTPPAAPTATPIPPTPVVVQPTAVPTPSSPLPKSNGQTPTSCTTVGTPLGTYGCSYPDGSETLYRSASDLTVLASGTRTDFRVTPAGCAVLFPRIRCPKSINGATGALQY